ncbi:hypothetical protein MLD38_038780 [Melastoma candidum]|uniref:Uncharacterized protein n=1 Tax=Melastoma candidum TaxID=119954 RepID=A0ACB9L1H4_9MYRT|nr:hypothetical protein MLD38_038780 [Melastoma candidum]
MRPRLLFLDEPTSGLDSHRFDSSAQQRGVRTVQPAVLALWWQEHLLWSGFKSIRIKNSSHDHPHCSSNQWKALWTG